MKYKFFWGGVFSNWYPSKFTVDNIEYNCGEQYMMYQKAMLFNDKGIANEIMNTIIPKCQKSLGKQVKNFDSVTWDKYKYPLVKKGLREKFKQNPILKEELLKYKRYEIVESSPFDRIWGIGYSENDALNNIENWGENLLGKILTELCEELQ